MAQQPSLMKIPFAQNGAKATIPETTTSLGVASLSQGFPTETQLPIADGGVPPRRMDVNGALYMLSMFAMFQQTGGKFTWSSELNYDVPSIIYHNNDLWWCVQSNGIATNIVEPGTNSSYWILLREYLSYPLAAYPVGAYYISSDPTSPATLFGGTWERVQDRMIVAAGSTFTAGTTGGSTAKTLSVQNMPYHNHSCDTQGGHTHTRGSMNITGMTYIVQNQQPTGNGAFSFLSHGKTYSVGGSVPVHAGDLYLNAANGWSGETSGNGWHSHNIGYNGNGLAFDVMNPYIVAYVWRRTA